MPLPTAKPDGQPAEGQRGPGKPGNRRSELRSRGRELAVQRLYSFEQNKYLDDGMLLPLDTMDGLESESIEFAGALQTGFAKERVAVDAAVSLMMPAETVLIPLTASPAESEVRYVASDP